MFLTSDGIEESYKHLRRLVMDYLGISIPSFESEAGDVMETKDTENAPTGTQLGTRTWSRPSIPDSMSQQYTRGKTTQSPSLSGRGILVSKENHPLRKGYTCKSRKLFNQKGAYFKTRKLPSQGGVYWLD